MMHSPRPSFVAHVCRTCVYVAILVAPAATTADHGTGLALAACSSKLAGSYLLSIDYSNGDLSSRAVLSLSKDGQLVVNDSTQGGVEGVFDPFTSGQGTWRCLGRRDFSAVSITFNVPGAIDPTGGLARVDYRGQLESDGRISGTIELRFFELSQNPLEDAVPPADTFVFTGQRIDASHPR